MPWWPLVFTIVRVHRNIIIIGDLSETYWWHIRDPLETSTCFIREEHAPSETNMPHQRQTRPIWDLHAPSETDLPHWRPTCPIRDWPAPLETDMPHQRPWETKMPGDSNRNSNTYILKFNNYFYILFAYLKTCRYLMGCRSGMSVSDWTCWFQKGLRWSMLRSPIRHVCLRWVSDMSPICLW